eukprot:5358892-Alexandrium_andersonii.AAC.1
MSASLVGSEMCIRDRRSTDKLPQRRPLHGKLPSARLERAKAPGGGGGPCLLYTSDAADDM